MEKEGFLLDIDYITEKDVNGKEKPVIRLWCKSKEGEDFIVLDKNFEPYFYAFPLSFGHEWDVEEKKGQIEKICIESGGEEIGVKRVEFCQKKLLGVNRRGLKIFVEHPRHVPLLREKVRKAGITVLEADILFAMRYLIDKQLRPFDGVNAEGEEIELSYANTKGAILASKVSYKKMNGSGLPELKILAFDTEMATQGGYGMPSPKRDPIIIISVAYSEGVGNEVKTKLFAMDKEEYGNGDDEGVLRDFLKFVDQFQPEIIVGYNSDGFDWQYIRERARLHAIRLRVGADGSTVQYEKGGALPGVNIAGRLNVDLFKLAKRDLDSVKVKKLENVAEFLGVLKKSERVNLSPREINDCWIDSSPSSFARQQLYEYAKADAVSTLGIAEKMLPLQIELSRMVGYPLDELAKMGRGRQVESFLTAEAFKKGELVPAKKGAEKTFEGGFVLPPEKGLHEDVISLDFSSMYPTIMISFNISPDTFVDSKEVGEELYIAPEVGHAFRKEPDGFFKRIMSGLITRRKEIKAEMKKYDKKSTEYRLLDIQQQSVKILTNSFYGYTGWSAAKFYKRECAEATTAWGRYFIKRAVKVAEEFGFEVIYGDTDSIFAKLSPDAGDGVEEYNRKAETLKKAREVSERISEELPLELEIQDFFKSIFFTGKKKRYAALTDKGEIVVRGLEVRRGDWCELAKEVQTKVIELILMEKDPDATMKYVKSVIKDLKEGKIPLDKLIIHKTLTRKISGYETKQAHVIAAEKALASRIVYEVGSKIPYVILKGVGKTSDRAFPVDLIERSEGYEMTAEGRRYQIDVTYYVQHQVIPVAHRVLQLFGYDLSSFEDMRQKTLGHWF
jgi:DNA polymerase I